MMDRYTDRLSEYLDDTLDARERAELETHLAGCEACRATLDDLRTIVAGAHALQPAEPANDLWPGIAERIETERELAMPLPDATPRRRGGMRRLSLTIPQLAAAAVVLVLASAGGAWMLAEQGGSTPLPGGRTGSVVPASAAGAPTVDAELAELEAALAGGEGQLDPATVAVLRRNLLIIDQALAEARAALEADPANPYLSRHYENTLNMKRDLLLQAGSIARGST